MILEHQSSNSTSNTSRATIKLYQRSMGNHSNVLERGRLFCSGYTQGMAIKMPRCIAIYAGKDYRITSMERH
jgi:hypothetical protein